MSNNARSVLVITNIPTPYRIPLFNELDRQLSAQGYKLKVVFGALGYSRRNWALTLTNCNFDYEVLKSKAIYIKNKESPAFTYPRLIKLIRRQRPVAIVTNGFSVATTKLWLRNLVKPTPYIIWSGAITRETEYRSMSRARILHRKAMAKGAASFVAYGTMAKDYLVSLGADEDKIHIAINTVDTDFFQREADQWRNREKPTNINQLLYVGVLSQRKRLDLVLQAIQILAKKRQDFILHLVGDGPAQKELEALATDLGITPYVSFEGFKQKSEIARYLAQSSCFLFPSEDDVWGLVLNEAMAAALPCISSIHAGATHDLICDGRTGFAMEFSNVKSVADRIDWLLNHREEAHAIGLAGRSFIDKRANLRISASGIVAAVVSCHQTGH